MKKLTIILLAVLILPVVILAQTPATSISAAQKKNRIVDPEPKAAPKTLIQTIVCPVVKDAWIYSFRPDSNYGNGYGWKDLTDPAKDITVPKMFLGFGGTDKKAVLLQFDLSRLPKGKAAKKAVIKIYNDYAGSVAETEVDAKMISQPWVEMKVTWRSKPVWTTSAISSTVLQGAIDYGQPGRWYEWDVTKMIKIWMVSKKPNYGIALDPRGDSGVDRDFICREYKGREQFFPVLEVTYEKQAQTQKPAADVVK